MESYKNGDVVNLIADNIVKGLLAPTYDSQKIGLGEANNIQKIADYFLAFSHPVPQIKAAYDEAVKKFAISAARSLVIKLNEAVPTKIKAELEKRLAPTGKNILVDKAIKEILAIAAGTSTLPLDAQKDLCKFSTKLADESTDPNDQKFNEVFEKGMKITAEKHGQQVKQSVPAFVRDLRQKLFPVQPDKSSCAHANHVQDMPPHVIEFIDVIRVHFINFQNNSFVPPHNLYVHYSRILEALKQQQDHTLSPDILKSWTVILKDLAKQQSPEMKVFFDNQKPAAATKMYSILKDKFQKKESLTSVIAAPDIAKPDVERQITDEIVRHILKHAQGYKEAKPDVKADFNAIKKHLLGNAPATAEVKDAYNRICKDTAATLKVKAPDRSRINNMLAILKDRFSTLSVYQQFDVNLAQELLKMSAGESKLQKSAQFDAHTAIKYIQQDPSNHHQTEFKLSARFIQAVATVNGIVAPDMQDIEKIKTILDNTRKSLFPDPEKEFKTSDTAASIAEVKEENQAEAEHEKILEEAEAAKAKAEAEIAAAREAEEARLKKAAIAAALLRKEEEERLKAAQAAAREAVLIRSFKGSMPRQLDRQQKLEGHADERGTREYNLALGKRRARIKDALAERWRRKFVLPYLTATKGQLGRGKKFGFEGGQMPLYRRLPKFEFTSRSGKLFTDSLPRFKERPGGYIRILKRHKAKPGPWVKAISDFAPLTPKSKVLGGSRRRYATVLDAQLRLRREGRRLNIASALRKALILRNGGKIYYRHTEYPGGLKFAQSFGVPYLARKHIRFDDNTVVLLDQPFVPSRTRIFGPVARELRKRRFQKTVSLATEVV